MLGVPFTVRMNCSCLKIFIGANNESSHFNCNDALYHEVPDYCLPYFVQSVLMVRILQFMIMDGFVYKKVGELAS